MLPFARLNQMGSPTNDPIYFGNYLNVIIEMFVAYITNVEFKNMLK